MTTPEAQRRRHLRRTVGTVLHRWHRRLGVSSALLVLWLALSGLVLHHTDGLGLDNVRFHTTWLTHWYGLDAAAPERGFVAGAHWLVASDDAGVLDGAALTPALPSPVLGMIEAGGMLVVATPHALVLLTPQGQRVDELKGAQLPVEDLHQLGSADGRIVIRDERLYASVDGEDWTPFEGAVQWSHATPLTPARQQQVAPLLRPSLSAVRVLEDAHSGRLFGHYGPLVMDLAALAFMLLAISGIWLFARRSLRR